MKRLLALSTLLLALNASATPLLEPLMGVLRDARGVTFQVFSGGCTSKSDFVVKQEESDGTPILALYRERPDHCMALYTYGIQIRFTYEELGVEPGQRFSLLNQLSN